MSASLKGNKNPTRIWLCAAILILGLYISTRIFSIWIYKTPSNSMAPTVTGKYVVTQSFGYGIKEPLLNQQIITFKKPKRGEVVTFNAPHDDLVMLSRIIGEPGDTVVYQDWELTINGEKLPLTKVEDYLDTNAMEYDPKMRRVTKAEVTMPQFEETIDGVTHRILKYPQRNKYDITAEMGFVANRPFIDECTYEGANFTCNVPLGHYFMMGDNRDDALDSRYLGFVPEKNIIAKVWIYG